jgi:hypothetical protein
MKNHFLIEAGDIFLCNGERFEFFLPYMLRQDGALLEPNGTYSAPHQKLIAQGLDGQAREFPGHVLADALRSTGGDGIRFLAPGDLDHLKDGQPIRAEIHDDDRRFEVNFDARLWFQQASDEELVALRECDFGGDYPADAIGEFFDGLNPLVSELFTNKWEGFEVNVNAEDALAWVAANRPEIMPLLANSVV